MYYTARYASILLMAVPLAAWNETGHKAVAWIAYQNLTPAARAEADALLKQHPDSGVWRMHPFLEAAFWPDVIRGNPQYDNPTWHYINLPFSPDGTPLTPADFEGPSVYTKIRQFRGTVGDKSRPGVERAVQLAWIEHLVGDVHQPLHTVARFSRETPKGDRGGNDVRLREARNLHSYWDGALGTTRDEQQIRKLAEDIMKSHPHEEPANLDVRAWVEDGFRAAKESVYTFGDGSGTKEPIALPEGYAAAAQKVARARAALAGYRLAALLNEALKARQ